MEMNRAGASAVQLWPLMLPDVGKELIDHSVNRLSRSGLQFDKIVGRGMSGVIFATLLGYALDKPFCIARKEGDNCHGRHAYRNGPGGGTYLAVDDHASSGRSMEALVSFQKTYDPGATLVALFFWNSYEKESRMFNNDPIWPSVYSKLQKTFNVPVIGQDFGYITWRQAKWPR